MRELKFRAWDKAEKRMYVFEEGYMLQFRDGKWAGQISVGGESIGPILSAENSVLMQYTGLKDKNGVEIYEGDIIEIVNGQTGQRLVTAKVVEWSADSARWRGLPLTHTCEVIGNIWENPELLKEES